MEKNVYRAYILVRQKMGKPPMEIFNDLKLAYQEDAPSYMTVCRWVTRFKDGSDDIEDEERPGRPITATTPSDIKAIADLIESNPYINFEEMEAETSISRGSIFTIIHDHLKFRKVISRWVPHLLNDLQKAKRVESCKYNLAKFNGGQWRLCDVITGDESWIYYRRIGRKQSNASWVAPGQPPRTVVRRNRFEPKSMITVFFRTTGPVLIDCMEKGQTINAKYYIKNCLKPAIACVEEQRPSSGAKNIKILHDNAKPHVAKIVKAHLESVGITIIDHPPYSPDLAPCDFWLFDRIKQQLTDHEDAESLKSQITEILDSIDTNEYHRAFQKYLERMQLCVNNKGEYFEHLMK